MKLYESLSNSILTYNAILALDRSSIIILTQLFKRRSTVQVIISNNALFNYINKNQNISMIIKSILRTYGGIFDQDVKINTLLIAAKVNVSEDVIINTLIKLEKDKIISLDLKNTDAEITFIEPREDDKTINRIAKTIETQNKQKVSRVNSVINYISDNDICKSKQLLSYFGESASTACGICSICIEKNKKGKTDIKPNGIEIVILLLQKEDLSSRDLLEQSMLPEIELTKIIQILLEKNAITVTNYNTYKLLK